MCESTDRETGLPYRCPVCGTEVAFEPAAPPYDAPCSECGHELWCRQRTVGDVAVLDILPGRTPEHWDIECVLKALEQKEGPIRVVLQMSDLDFVSSALVARLVAMNKGIQAAGGKLTLCGLRPVVQEAFARVRLDKAFVVCSNEAAALASL
jgi:anti-sigma B factor antagonist